MSYLVLARKYRPHNFETLVGQAHVVQALFNALSQQRLHHAYLFTGTRGVGKTTVSRILAKSLNCTGPDGQGGITAQPCGVCTACHDIDAGRFADYVELDAASHRGVEEISQLLDQAVYKPVLGRFKVYMIDEVHMLSTTAFNAMLKTLEEPPEYLKFVLATTDPQKVPPTVLSRCLHFNLRPMAPSTIQDHLAHVLEKEQLASESGALHLLARAARGSMRDALSLTDQAIAFGAGRLTEDGVRQMLGTVDRSHCVALLASLAAGDGAALVERCRALREQGVPPASILEDLAELCQQVALFQVVPEALRDGSEDLQVLDAVSQLAKQWLADELQLFYSMCLHGRAELHLAPDEHSALLMVLLRMLAFRSENPPPERMQALPSPAATVVLKSPSAVLLQTKAPGVSMPMGAPVPSPTEGIPPWVDAPETDTETDTDLALDSARLPPDNPLDVLWSNLVRDLICAGKISALPRELAMNAQCIHWHYQADTAIRHCVLRVEREILTAPQHVEKLRLALAEHLGLNVNLRLEIGAVQHTAAMQFLEEKEMRQREAERVIHEDPFVRSLLEQFTGARIVPGSVHPQSAT